MTPQNNTVTLTVATFNKVAEYLETRPYKEVAGLAELLKAELTPKTPPVTSVNAPEATNVAPEGNTTVSEEERDLSA